MPFPHVLPLRHMDHRYMLYPRHHMVVVQLQVGEGHPYRGYAGNLARVEKLSVYYGTPTETAY